jgi:hypothetical protein
MSETKEKRTIVETVPNAVRYSDGTILLKNVRLSYPWLFQPQANKAKDGTVTYSYSVTGLMPKATHDEAKKMCVRVINSLLKEHNKGEKIPSDKKFCRDGDPKDEDDAGKPENAGMWVVATREQKKPTLLDKYKDPKTGKARRLTDKDKDMLYGGCWGNILIRPWYQDNEYGKRVNAGISVVQFVKDDAPFGSGRITDDDIDDTFEAEGSEASADDEDIDDL